MRYFYRSRLKSIQFAISGFRYVLRTQPNAWVHAFITLCIFLLAIFLYLPLRDWAVLILTICIVWVAEFINTAIEAAVDLASPQVNPLAKICKDVSAAAVLIAALSSIFIGILILGPPLWEKLTDIPGL